MGTNDSNGKREQQRGYCGRQRVVRKMQRHPVEQQRRGAAAHEAHPAHLPHPSDAVADQAPDHIGDGLDQEEGSPDARPLRHAEAYARRGVEQRHDHREAKQREIADDAGDERQRNVAVVEDERDTLADLREFAGFTALKSGVRHDRNAAGKEVDEQSASQHPGHRHPEGPHVADPLRW